MIMMGCMREDLILIKIKKIIISPLSNSKKCSILIMTNVIFKCPDAGDEETKKFLQLCVPHGNSEAELCLQKTKDKWKAWKYPKQESVWGAVCFCSLQSKALCMRRT